jgi:formylglycine-generating enzyme required for sulfatase activity
MAPIRDEQVRPGGRNAIASRGERDAAVPLSLHHLGFRAQASAGTLFIAPPVSLVPAGPFTMGSDRTLDPKAYRDETPQHQASTIAFWMGNYPVTVAEYEYAVQAEVVGPPREFKGISWHSQLAHRDYPVTSVSWFEAVTYCLWLGEMVGAPCRLPTEAEWEKAARGTDGRIYPWGMTWDRDLANTPDGGLGRIAAVASYPDAVSPYGLHDMVGNVWEWCNSIYRPYPYRPEDGREEFGVADTRVLRGSAWYCVPYNARTTCRGLGPSGLYLGGGFRVLFPARSADPADNPVLGAPTAEDLAER